MTDIQNIAPHARVWIYQCSRLLSAAEASYIKQKAAVFINQWTSHGQQMDACIEVLYNCFVVVLVDEKKAPASGCGIDKSVRFIQEMETELTLSLMERMNVAYRDKTNLIKICSLQEFEQLIDAGIVSEDTVVFNNLVSNKQDFFSKWEIHLHNSWHARLLKTIKK